ncbi:MAG: hypothetical protein ACRDTR_23950 [Rubrobacter sp.]
MSEGMGHRRRVPEDLMGTILGEGSEAPGEDRTLSEPRGDGSETGSRFPEDDVSWEERPERVGTTFNLSKQVNAELERLRLELEEDVRPSRSEIAEVALRIAVEDVQRRGRESELVKRLVERHAAQVPGAIDEGGLMTRRSVDGAGFIVETVYDESGRIVDEEVVASIADFPVETEYVDEKGRLVSLAKDELGNTFEQILDDELNVLGTRLLPGAG